MNRRSFLSRLFGSVVAVVVAAYCPFVLREEEEHRRWPYWGSGYQQSKPVSKDDLIQKMRLSLEKTKFEPPVLPNPELRHVFG